MKKNYIAHLQEYEARTSSICRQDKYRKKFIKTIYFADKQNNNPNIPNSSHKKKNKKKEGTDHKKSPKSQNNSRLPTENKEQIKLTDQDETQRASLEPQNKKKVKNQELYELKMRFIKLERLICQKEDQEKQKCLLYYEWMKQDICSYERQALDFISQIYEKAKTEVANMLNQLNGLQFSKLIRPQLPRIELELATVVINNSLKEKLKESLKSLSLFNISNIPLDYPIKQRKKQDFCPQRMKNYGNIEQDSNHTDWFQGDSFAVKQGFNSQESYSVEEGQGISPTFKKF